MVEVGRGANAIFGGTPDFLTTLSNGYYTVVSSLPSDKPSPSSLTANDATWIPTSARHPGTPELQLLRNMLSQPVLYPEGFTFISPPASPSDIIAGHRARADGHLLPADRSVHRADLRDPGLDRLPGREHWSLSRATNSAR